MPSVQCFVCASDDGTFLDIFAASKEYCHNIETCLSLKVPKTHISTSKLCHKCAYELEQCSKFVANYTKTKQRGNGNLYKKQGCCCICMEPGKNGKIFDLWDENPMNKCVEKIQKLFNYSLLPGDTCTLSICLDCRYNLDVLFDLKRLAEKPYKFSELTKMKTSVVNRKTAICRRPKLSNSSDSETEMAPPPPAKPAKAQKSTRPAILSKATSVKPPPKLQLPAKAESPEQIVPEAPAPRNLQSDSSTKSGRECEACHEEIPTGSATYKFNITGQRVCQECWKATDLTGDLPSKKNRKLKISAAVETKPCTVLVKDIKLFPDEVQAALFKNPAKKTRKPVKTLNGDETTEISDFDNSDDSHSLRKRAMQLRGPKKRKNSDDYTISLRKKIAMEVNAAPPRATRASSVQVMPSTSKQQKSYAQSYSDDTNRIKYTPKRRGRPRKFPITPMTPNRTKSRTSPAKAASEDEKLYIPRVSKRSRLESTSTESSDTTFVSRRSKKSRNEVINVDSESDPNASYECNICKTKYNTKMSLLTHELTHSKKPSLLLKKVNIPGDTDDQEQSSEMNFTTKAEVLREDEPIVDLNDSDMSPLTDSNTAESGLEVSSPETAGESTTQSNIMKQSTVNDSDGTSNPDKMSHSPKDSSDETIDVVASDPEYPLERIKRNLQESMDKGMKMMDLDTETETEIDVEYVKSDEDKAVNMDKSVKDTSDILADDAAELESNPSTTILEDETKDLSELLDTSKESNAEEDADNLLEPAQSDPKENAEELSLTLPKENAEAEEAQMPNGILDPTEAQEPDEPETDFTTGPLERTDSVGSVEYPEFKLIHNDSNEVTEEKTEKEKNGQVNENLDKTLIVDELDKTPEVIENHSEATAPKVSDPPPSEDKISEVNNQSENVTDKVDNSTKSVELPVQEDV